VEIELTHSFNEQTIALGEKLTMHVKKIFWKYFHMGHVLEWGLK
jgi:hypothetical protein